MYLGIVKKITRSLAQIRNHIRHFWAIGLLFLLVIIATLFSLYGEWHLFKILTGISIILAVILLCTKSLLARILIHIQHFWPMGLVFLLMIIASLLSLYGEWHLFKILTGISIILAIILLCIRPLNAVYGLMGTSGSINIFFINIILFCFIFSGIYYVGFFKNAGISYDVNQPHISYEMFADSTSNNISLSFMNNKSLRDTSILRSSVDDKEYTILYENDGKTIKDTLIQRKLKTEVFYYQSVDFPTVLRNTIITFLMQEPTDLFSIASNYNASFSGTDDNIDKQKTELFHWILIFQVLVGWIFFGVFISLLYNKFRYES